MKINIVKARRSALSYLKSLIFPIIMWLLFLLISLAGGHASSFVSAGGFDNIFRTSIQATIVGIAIALPLSGGRWDFATGTIVVLGGIIGGNIGIAISDNLAIVLICCVVSSVILALVEAAAYILLRVPNMIVSLGMVMIYESLTSILFDGQGIKLNSHNNILAITQAPMCYIVLAIVLVTMYILLEHTKFGADCKSLGKNAPLALNSGVNEKKNIVLTYLVVGCLLGIAALFNAATTNVGSQSNLGSTSIMYSSMGAVLVGLFLADSTCMPWGVWLGAVGMQTMTYGMICSGLDSSLQNVVMGVVIVAIMAYTSNQAEMSQWLRKFLGYKKLQNA